MTTQTPDPEPMADKGPSPRQSNRVKMAPMTWEAPNPQDTTPGSSLDAATDAGAAPSPGYPQMSAAPPEQPSTRSGSSQESSPARRAPFIRGASVFFDTATRLLHRFLARDEYDRAVELYKADKDDLAAMSAPAGRLAYRHAGEVGAASNPDIADGAELGFAVIGYFMKQLDRQLEARDLRRRGAHIDGLQPNLTTEVPA